MPIYMSLSERKKEERRLRQELILKGALEVFKTKGSAAILIDVNSGEILSLTSLPDFNPNYPETILPNTENNLSTEARYEMGSTLKIFNAAIAYESNSTSQNDQFDISNG